MHRGIGNPTTFWQTAFTIICHCTQIFLTEVSVVECRLAGIFLSGKPIFSKLAVSLVFSSIIYTQFLSGCMGGHEGVHAKPYSVLQIIKLTL